MSQAVGEHTHFFGIEVLLGTVYVLSQCYPVEPFADRCLDDLFQCILGMRTELAGVAVVCERHLKRGDNFEVLRR
jgi:hypothetical protein